MSLCPVGEAVDHAMTETTDLRFEWAEWECLTTIHAQCDGGTSPCAPCAAFLAAWTELAERIGAA